MGIRGAAGLLVIAFGLGTCGGGSNGAEPQEAPAGTTAAVSNLGLEQVGTFSAPTYVTAPRGDRSRLFVVEQQGTIRVIHKGRRVGRPYLDIKGRVTAGGEQGLLSMAFAPDYARSRRFYVYYTGTGGDIRVVEFKGRRNRARKSSARSILTVEHSEHSNHNGGQLQFGPDGRLYIGTGDGGGGGDPYESGQDLGSRLGKILRMDPRRRGARPRVYSYGLRNPWRFSFDRANGDLVIGDVGQNEWEEIDFVRKGGGKGANFGWDAYEGTHRYEGGDAPGHIPPVIEHSHGEGFCSITGGYILRHRSYGELRGTYVYGDFCEPRLRGARLAPGRATGRRTFAPTVGSLSSFGEDARGRVYAVSLNGPVYRLVPR